MQLGGPIFMVGLILFVLFMIYDVSTSDGSERKKEWFVEACAPVAGAPTCIFRSGPINGTSTPWQCQHNGMLKAVELLKQRPGWVIMKFGCRRASLDV